MEAPPTTVQQKQNASQADQSTTSAAAATASLNLLLREDPLLLSHKLTTCTSEAASSSGTSASSPALQYAAAILDQQQQQQQTSANDQDKAELALQDVERKLALVESLAVKLSRTAPEAVAGHLLRLHGHTIVSSSSNGSSASTAEQVSSTITTRTTATSRTPTATLESVRDRADRLERQAHVMETVATRVESSLSKGHARMRISTRKLQRVLDISLVLKLVLRLFFENEKLQTYVLEDVRDLQRAAQSVAIVQDLLQQLDENNSSNNNSESGGHQQQDDDIDIVRQLRPQAEATARNVRLAAAQLLEQTNIATTTTASTNTANNNNSISVRQWSTTLQVYYSLGELPHAVWQVVDRAHDQAVQACRNLFSPDSSQSLLLSRGGGGGGNKHHHITTMNNSNKTTTTSEALRRLDAAALWAAELLPAAQQVRDLERVLTYKSDPVLRRPFVQVVMAQSPIPAEYNNNNNHNTTNNNKLKKNKKQSSSLFQLYWTRVCQSLAEIIEEEASSKANNNKHQTKEAIASLYPAVRSQVPQLLGRLSSSQQNNNNNIVGNNSSNNNAIMDDNLVPVVAGSLGGSTMLDDSFLEWTTTATNNNNNVVEEDNPQAAPAISADAWTHTTHVGFTATTVSGTTTSGNMMDTSSSLAAPIASSHHHHQMALQTPEYQTLTGSADSPTGIYPLEQAFVTLVTERLCSPLQYMFPDMDNAATMDDVDGGAAVSGLSNMLPSKYDIQRFDETIRNEMALISTWSSSSSSSSNNSTTSSTGSIDLAIVQLVATAVTGMIREFCSKAQNALSGDGVSYYNGNNNWSTTMSETLQHDRKIVMILYTVAKNLRAAPDNVYGGTAATTTTTSKLNTNNGVAEQAVQVARAALQPGLDEISEVVRRTVVKPLCQMLNQHIAAVMAQMHHQGTYAQPDDGDNNNSTPFVQDQLQHVYESISKTYLSKFPPEYAAIIASKVASFSIYTFCSHMVLVRPLSEGAKLNMTQDLADLELSLEQLVKSVSGNKRASLATVGQGRPYAELRAVREMIFWVGLENQSHSAADVAKGLLRENWVRNVRPLTLLHFLVGHAPSLLSSPHHHQRVSLADYVQNNLVHLDGTTNDEDGWMTILAICDSYRQRATTATSTNNTSGGGDSRVADILVVLGPQLLQRRRG